MSKAPTKRAFTLYESYDKKIFTDGCHSRSLLTTKPNRHHQYSQRSLVDSSREHLSKILDRFLKGSLFIVLTIDVIIEAPKWWRWEWEGFKKCCAVGLPLHSTVGWDWEPWRLSSQQWEHRPSHRPQEAQRKYATEKISHNGNNPILPQRYQWMSKFVENLFIQNTLYTSAQLSVVASNAINCISNFYLQEWKAKDENESCLCNLNLTIRCVTFPSRCLGVPRLQSPRSKRLGKFRRKRKPLSWVRICISSL